MVESRGRGIRREKIFIVIYTRRNETKEFGLASRAEAKPSESRDGDDGIVRDEGVRSEGAVEEADSTMRLRDLSLDPRTVKRGEQSSRRGSSTDIHTSDQRQGPEDASPTNEDVSESTDPNRSSVFCS